MLLPISVIECLGVTTYLKWTTTDYMARNEKSQWDDRMLCSIYSNKIKQKKLTDLYAFKKIIRTWEIKLIFIKTVYTNGGF